MPIPGRRRRPVDAGERRNVQKHHDEECCHPIILESFYNGGDIFPKSPTSSPYTSTPVAQDAYSPDYEDVLYSNITVAGASNACLIEGLNETPATINGLTFDNVNISAKSQMNLWYASNVDLSGLTVTVPSNKAYYGAAPSGVWLADDTFVAVPEPAGFSILAIGVAALSLRGRRFAPSRRRSA